jgi:tRNA threonylcarbamoyladenosine biosynthesis protein TsaE
MMIQKYTITDVSIVAQKLVHQPVRVWTLEGSLGAGKTTLVQAMLKAWGVQGLIQSPTYSYVTQYQVAGKTLYHFDVYRLTSAQDFIQAGFDEYLYDESALILIEWPEIIESLLPRPRCAIHIEYVSDTERALKITTLE